jgi:hypothetical protein
LCIDQNGCQKSRGHQEAPQRLHSSLLWFSSTNTHTHACAHTHTHIRTHTCTHTGRLVRFHQTNISAKLSIVFVRNRNRLFSILMQKYT